MASARISRAFVILALDSLASVNIYTSTFFVQNFLLSTENCSKIGEVASTALQLSQPCGDGRGRVSGDQWDG